MKRNKNKNILGDNRKEFLKDNVNYEYPAPSAIDHNIKKEALGPNTKR